MFVADKKSSSALRSYSYVTERQSNFRNSDKDGSSSWFGRSGAMSRKMCPAAGLVLFLVLSASMVCGSPARAASQNESDSEVDLIERGNDLVDQALVPVYDMVNGFLENLIQPNDLTYMEEKGVDFSDPDSIVESLENNYEEWLLYAVGEFICLHLRQNLMKLVLCMAF